MNILLNDKLVDTVEVLIKKFLKGVITLEQYLKELRKRFLKHQHNVLQERIIAHRNDANAVLAEGLARLKETEKELHDAHYSKIDERVDMIDRKRKLWYKY